MEVVRASPSPVEQRFHVGLATGAGVRFVTVVEHGQAGVLGDPVVTEAGQVTESPRQGESDQDQFGQRDQVLGALAAPPQAQSGRKVGQAGVRLRG